MPGKGRRTVAVKEISTQAVAPAPRRSSAAKESAPSTRPAPDGLWFIALMRVALELKRGGSDLQRISDRVAQRMGLPREDFAEFLAMQLEGLR